MFKELTNKSKSINMYPVSDKRNEIKELFNRRHTSDFANKHGVPYVPPPVVKDFEKKHSFVHNCLANKPKNNVEFLEKIFNKNILNTQKRKILSAMHQRGIDFRMFSAFKNALFDSDDLTENQFVPLSVYYEIADYEMSHLLNGELNELILLECQDGDRVDLNKINDLCDLFFYLPKKQKKNARNESSDMWYILSSNIHSGPTTSEVAVQGGPLKKILDLLWIKIHEKFRGLAEAYRFFDVNFNNRVSFNEFQKALDHMRIKF